MSWSPSTLTCREKHPKTVTGLQGVSKRSQPPNWKYLLIARSGGYLQEGIPPRGFIVPNVDREWKKTTQPNQNISWHIGQKNT